MRAYRERITVQAPTKVDVGYNQKRVSFPAESFVPGMRCMPARYEYIRGLETYRGRQIQADVHAVFEVRTPALAILPTYQVLHVNSDNKAYGIVSVQPAEGKSEGGFRRTYIFVKALSDA